MLFFQRINKCLVDDYVYAAQWNVTRSIVKTVQNINRLDVYFKLYHAVMITLTGRIIVNNAI